MIQNWLIVQEMVRESKDTLFQVLFVVKLDKTITWQMDIVKKSFMNWLVLLWLLILQNVMVVQCIQIYIKLL